MNFLTDHEEAITDAAFGVGTISIPGIFFLVLALSNYSMRLLGLRGSLSLSYRWAALLGGNLVIGTSFALAYGYLGVTPLEVWDGALLWWQDGKLGGRVMAIGSWAAVLSPVLSIACIYAIIRQYGPERERDEVLKYHYP